MFVHRTVLRLTFLTQTIDTVWHFLNYVVLYHFYLLWELAVFLLLEHLSVYKYYFLPHRRDEEIGEERKAI